MENTVLVSEIPGNHPRKDAIEWAVREAFERLPGGWRIVIRRADPRETPWGFLEIDGPNGFQRVLVIEDLEDVRAWVKHDFSWIPDRFPT